MKKIWLLGFSFLTAFGGVAFADSYPGAIVPKGVPGTIQVLGKCLSARQALRHEVLRLEDCTNGHDQQFTFREDGSITNQGWCLDIPNQQAVSHQSIQLFDCRNQLNQKFVTDGQNHLSTSGFCLDVPNSEASCGTKIQLFACRHQANQSFVFYPSH